MNNNSHIIAIDIALLPPKEIMEKIISINKDALVKGIAWGTLGVDDFIPHISIAMGGIQEEKLNEVIAVVEGIADDFSELDVELYELYYGQKSDGTRSYALRAKRTDALFTFHKRLMDALHSYFSYDCTESALFTMQGEIVSEPDYLNNFLRKKSYDSYDPHITLRAKEPIGESLLPLQFTINHLVICHVGSMTTCRKILFSTVDS